MDLIEVDLYDLHIGDKFYTADLDAFRKLSGSSQRSVRQVARVRVTDIEWSRIVDEQGHDERAVRFFAGPDSEFYPESER